MTSEERREARYQRRKKSRAEKAYKKPIMPGIFLLSIRLIISGVPTLIAGSRLPGKVLSNGISSMHR